jgi:predicted Zn-dependent protease
MEGHSQNQPQTQAVPLPVNRAFVVQFQGTEAGQAAVIAGRVEHVTSGHRVRFQSWEQLHEFIEHELAQLEKAAARPKPEGS